MALIRQPATRWRPFHRGPASVLAVPSKDPASPMNDSFGALIRPANGQTKRSRRKMQISICVKERAGEEEGAGQKKAPPIGHPKGSVGLAGADYLQGANRERYAQIEGSIICLHAKCAGRSLQPGNADGRREVDDASAAGRSEGRQGEGVILHRD